MAKRAGVFNRIANWWYMRGLARRLHAAIRAGGVGSSSTGSKGMVAGRPTSAAGLTSLWSGQYSLLGRTYGSYRDVLETLKHIRDYNPDAALAVWNVLRLANPGHELAVYYSQPGPEGQPVEDVEGKALLEELCDQVGSEYGGGVDTLIDVMNLTLMTQGAIAAEVELSENLREVLDYCPVDPRWIDFATDEETGKMVPVIAAYGAVKRINTNQFRYIPLDPDVDDPHGRSPMWTTLEIIFFQQEVLRDLKAVMHNQGYPRLDVSVLEEIVVQNTPEHLKAPGREDEFRQWVDGFLSDLQTTYNSLNPDDTFIHWDWVKVGYVGATNGVGSIDVARVIQVIDSQMVAALKQLPVLLGRNEGATTTHATVQWQIYVAGIEALQRRTKRMVEWLHNTALQVYGRQSYARIEFDEIRKSDRKTEAEAERIETETAVMQVQAGWIDNDEAAMGMVGHEAVGEMAVPDKPTTKDTKSTKEEEEGEEPAAEEDEEAGEEGTRAAKEPIHGGVAAVPPEGIPDWLWERARATGLAYEQWAKETFDGKLNGYLQMESTTNDTKGTKVEIGGNGDGRRPHE